MLHVILTASLIALVVADSSRRYRDGLVQRHENQVDDFKALNLPINQQRREFDNNIVILRGYNNNVTRFKKQSNEFVAKSEAANVENPFIRFG
uniref:Cathepsin propeptide inhibitor domain-containing protein n=1 Tax=Panagrellus redivivus TaxID=6233 RepID=A0A7E4V8G3_PANRE